MNHILLIAVHILIYGAFAWVWPPVHALSALALMGLLIWISCTDFIRFEIPDTASALLFLSGLALSGATPSTWIASAGAGGLWFLLFWGVAAGAKYILKRDALGFGDVKLMGGVGAWLGVLAPIYVVFLASLTGALTLLCLGAARREKLSEQMGNGIAFGPFLCLCTWVIWLSEAGL